MTKRQHDIERYLRGEMSSAERHALEKEALSDPFLADALEGTETIEAGNFLVDLKDLRLSVANRSRQHKPKMISWNWAIGIAASLLLLAISGIYIIDSINERQPMQAENVSEFDAAALWGSQNDTLDIVMPRTRAFVPLRIERVASGRTRQIVEREVDVDLTDATTIQIERDEAASQRPASTRNELSVKTRVVKGKVTSAEDGSALPGVNVIVKGTNIGTITDAEGKYEIQLHQPDQKLEFTFIGVRTVEAETRNKSQVDVSLVPDYESLTEVVVTGAAVREEDKGIFKLAEPEGGRDAYTEYLTQKLVYPEQALANHVEGKVRIQFTVDLNGQISNFKILNSLGFGCDDEAIRLIREGPSWAPSKKNDKPVAEEVTIGLKFDIPNKN